jgi:hypothetical protein
MMDDDPRTIHLPTRPLPARTAGGRLWEARTPWYGVYGGYEPVGISRQPSLLQGTLSHRMGESRGEGAALGRRDQPFPELVVVGQVVHERGESADLPQGLTPHRHHGAKREAQPAQTPRLQDAAPEIGVHRQGLPAHRRRCRPVQLVEGIH